MQSQLNHDYSSASKERTTLVVTDCDLHGIVLRNGCPLHIHSDVVRNFIPRIVQNSRAGSKINDSRSCVSLKLESSSIGPQQFLIHVELRLCCGSCCTSDFVCTVVFTVLWTSFMIQFLVHFGLGSCCGCCCGTSFLLWFLPRGLRLCLQLLIHFVLRLYCSSYCFWTSFEL